MTVRSERSFRTENVNELESNELQSVITVALEQLRWNSFGAERITRGSRI